MKKKTYTLKLTEEELNVILEATDSADIVYREEELEENPKLYEYVRSLKIKAKQAKGLVTNK